MSSIHAAIRWCSSVSLICFGGTCPQSVARRGSPKMGVVHADPAGGLMTMNCVCHIIFSSATHSSLNCGMVPLVSSEKYSLCSKMNSARLWCPQARSCSSRQTVSRPSGFRLSASIISRTADHSTSASGNCGGDSANAKFPRRRRGAASANADCAASDSPNALPQACVAIAVHPSRRLTLR